MYPYLRLAKVIVAANFGRRLDFRQESALRLFVWPGDIDVYPEVNNGRHLTLMDLGRIDLAARSGFLKITHKNGWSFTAAGASVRFRRRMRPLRHFTLRTQLLGHDDRWFYFDQRTEQGGRTCSAALVRAGIASRQGLVPVAEVLEAVGVGGWNPPLPAWVAAWIAAEAQRPWQDEATERIPKRR